MSSKHEASRIELTPTLENLGGKGIQSRHAMEVLLPLALQPFLAWAEAPREDDHPFFAVLAEKILEGSFLR